MNYINNFDFGILNFIYENLHTDFLDSVVPIISSWGNGGKLWLILSAILIIIPKTRKIGIASLLAVIIGFIVTNLTLKTLCGRLRPFQINYTVELLINPPRDYSFPSGHTCSSFAAAVGIFCFNRKLGIPALIMASIIAMSRLYLYVHYPTDVLVGALIGILAGISASKIVNYMANKNKRFRRIK